MDIKTSVKTRREARIRELLEGEASPAPHDKSSWGPFPRNSLPIPIFTRQALYRSTGRTHPRFLQRVNRIPSGFGSKGTAVGMVRWIPVIQGTAKKSFVSVGLGAPCHRQCAGVWIGMGVFSFQHPWALRTQAFIVEGLSHEMDFKQPRYGMRSTLEAPLPSFRFLDKPTNTRRR